MGLLQKLLGRRTEEPSGEPESAQTPVAEGPSSTPEPSDPPATSGVLADAAPLPDTPAATPKPPTEDTADSEAGVSSAPQTETIVEPEDPVATHSDDTETDDSETDDTATYSAIDDLEPDTELADNVDIQTKPEPAARKSDHFVPERPRRELLDLEPPKPPEEETVRPGSDTLPLEVSGSPRTALRNAGVKVPHMQQIVQRGDVRLWAFGVRANEALGWWLQIRQVHEQTGWLPVLLGPADDWLDNGEGVLHEGDNELSRMDEVNALDLLRDKAAEAGEPPRGVPILPTRGDSDFAVPKTDGLLGLVEAEDSWEIPALLPWKGSTNWELYGAEHAQILKRWHEQHEVELVSMTWDILELYVPNPPSADEDVLTVAGEAYAYCPDLLQAGVPTLDDLAVHMVRARAWYFRWN